MKKKTKFKPFAITINVENELDLVELWLRFNSSFEPFKEDLDSFIKQEDKELWKAFFDTENNDASNELWELLNRKVEEFELKKKDV